jgi:hypothetical protein
MSFIKRGGDTDGKIVSVVEEDELTDAQKKSAQDLSKKPVKSGNADASANAKKSGS